jgi:6,7-dimethyl-8-ribityllumazine synthase
MQNNYAIIVSEFNAHITDKLLSGALERLKEHGIKDDQIKTFRVPGAIEIPLIAQLLAKQKKYAAIICLGAVIRGETGHYDFVCKQVSDGCQKVMMEHDLPVIFGVLTTENNAQAEDRVGGAHGHKGKYSADAAITMVEIIKSL